jgi:hypothetical protein
VLVGVGRGVKVMVGVGLAVSVGGMGEDVAVSEGVVVGKAVSVRVGADVSEVFTAVVAEAETAAARGRPGEAGRPEGCLEK